MAKLIDYGPRYSCPQCNTPYDVEIEEKAPADWEPTYAPRGHYTTIYKHCVCAVGGTSTVWATPTNTKETKVTKQFDTAPNKNSALNAVLNRVEDIERALLNRSVARAKLEAEHTALLTEASVKLDRAVAESLHSGVYGEDYELYLPEYHIDLSERVLKVSQIMSLANVLESV